MCFISEKIRKLFYQEFFGKIFQSNKGDCLVSIAMHLSLRTAQAIMDLSIKSVYLNPNSQSSSIYVS